MSTLEEVAKLITSHPDFPKPGITFYDIHPIMASAEARNTVTNHLYERYKGWLHL
jgi:adenine/guanine phosphoribosyltransferase-like PRPP-binding protein